MPEIVAVVGLFTGILLLVMAVGAFLGGLIIWALWNALVPSLFDGPHISYWHGVLVGLALSFVGSLFRSSVSVQRT